MCRPVGGARAAAPPPGVASQASICLKCALREHLTLTGGRPAHDQLDRATVRSRLPDVIEARFQRGRAEMLHRAMMPPPAP